MSIIASTSLSTRFGTLNVAYHHSVFGECITFSKGNIRKGIPIVRLHSSCLFGEAFGSLHCDCHNQLEQALQLIAESRAGVVVYAYDEGRGIGLEKKIQAMHLQHLHGYDTVEAFQELGLGKSDFRHYLNYIDALNDLRVAKTIRLFSSNPAKEKALREAGYKIKGHIDINEEGLESLAQAERKVKQGKLGYRRNYAS